MKVTASTVCPLAIENRTRSSSRLLIRLPQSPSRPGVVHWTMVSVAGGDRCRARDRPPSPLDQLLAAVDVHRRAGDGSVGHEMNGQGRDVGRADDAPDG